MKKKLTISKRTSRHIKTTKTSSKHINVYNKLKLLEKAGKIKDINIIKKLLLNKIKDIDIITYNRVLDEESELHKFLTKYVKTEWSKSRSDEKRKDLKLHRFYNFVIKKISDRTIKDNTNNKVTKIALVSNLNILLTQIINSGAIKLKDAKTIKIINQLLTDKDFLIYGDSSAIKYFGKKEGDNYMKYAKINELTMNTFDITEYDTPVMIESIGKHMFILKNTDYDYSRGNYTLVEIKDCLNEYTGDSELIKELKRILDEQFKIYPQQQPSLPKPKKHPDEQVPSTESDTCSNNDCFIFYEADIDLVSMKKTYSEFKKNLSSGTYKFLSPPSQPPRRSIVYIDNTDEMRTVDTSPLKAITRGEILTRMTSDELNEDQSITTRAPTSPPPAPSISDDTSTNGSTYGDDTSTNGSTYGDDTSTNGSTYSDDSLNNIKRNGTTYSYDIRNNRKSVKDKYNKNTYDNNIVSNNENYNNKLKNIIHRDTIKKPVISYDKDNMNVDVDVDVRVGPNMIVDVDVKINTDDTVIGNYTTKKANKGLNNDWITGYDEDKCIIRNKSTNEELIVAREKKDNSECDFKTGMDIKLWVNNDPHGTDKIIKYENLENFPDKKCKIYNIDETRGIKYKGPCKTELIKTKKRST